jgi:hypothetical protein
VNLVDHGALHGVDARQLLATRRLRPHRAQHEVQALLQLLQRGVQFGDAIGKALEA